jgi:hypothetical protein
VTRLFRGSELWTVSQTAAKRFKLHYLRGDPHRRGLSTDASMINTGRNSGFQSLGLAHYFGASRVILLGYDFQRTGGRAHWHADHPRSLGNGGRFPAWVDEMKQLAHDLKDAGVEVINCSRTTALKCFPRSTIQEVL